LCKNLEVIEFIDKIVIFKKFGVDED